MASSSAADARWAARRAALYRQLEPAAWTGAGVSPVNRVVTVAILASVAAAILETEATIRDGRETLFKALEIGFGLLFLAEYVGRIWTAPERTGATSAFAERRAYVLSAGGLIDLVALSPLFFALIGPEAFLMRLVRVLRIIRLARLGRFSVGLEIISHAVWSRRYDLLAGLSLSGVLLIVASALLYMAEAEAQPEAFGSIPRAMWWAVVTLTTVGYGDAAPITALGRIFAGMVAITGIGLIAIPTGILAAAFSDGLEERRRRKREAEEREKRR